MSMIKIPYYDDELNINIITSAGRCVDIVVDDDLNIYMRVPLGMQRNMIEQYARINRESIISEYEKARMRNHQAMQAPMELKEGVVVYRNGMRLPYLGKMDLFLRIVRIPDMEETRIYSKTNTDGSIVLTVKTDQDDQDFLRYLIMRYYKKLAGQIIRRKAEEYAGKMRLVFDQIQVVGLVRGTDPRFPKMAYQNIEIKHQKTLWGSCSRKKNLKFDWKLVMLPEEIMDYVIVHELGHLRKMNHSSGFWRQLEKVMPEYRECRSWLDKHGAEYEIF